VTDYTEPQNLFALAVNSPPNQRLDGSCGAGPKGDQLNFGWHVGQEEGTNHYFIKEGGGGGGDARNVNEVADAGEEGVRQRKGKQRLQSMSSYMKLSSRRTSWL